jgi:hypothetical protein
MLARIRIIRHSLPADLIPSMHRIPVLLTLVLLTVSTICADDQFTQSVAPLLEKRCLHCHNDDDQKGDFSLQSRQQLLDSGFVVPGNAANSHLLAVVQPSVDSAKPAMPEDGEPLTADEVSILKNWIQAGALWPDARILQEPVLSDFDWWSFRPLQTQVPPEFSDPSDNAWIRNPIDAFVLAKLKEKSLHPSPEADRRTLIRRLTYDLIGLPPTPEEIHAFVSDVSDNAYEALVERLLASPQSGERWARHWLDVVRYADTCGYDKDKLRPNAWPYRDYVIRSFNDDKPYGRFVEEQVAGDVLYPGNPDGILGLGFIAAGPWDFIGHVEVPESKIDGKVARNLDRDDMVTGTLNAFCSVTIQCARCHNHKFDPFTQEHYYSLQSVFAAVDRAERVFDTDPAIESRRSELTRTLQQQRSGLKELDDEIRKEGGKTLSTLESEITQLTPTASVVSKRPEFGYHSATESQADVEQWVEVDLGGDVAIESLVLHPCHDDFGSIGAGFGFPVRYRIEYANAADRATDRTNDGLQILTDSGSADQPNPGLDPVVVTKPATARYVRITATRLALRSNDYIFALAELEVLDAAGKNVAAGRPVTARNSIEAPDRWRKSNLTDGLWATAQNPDAARELAAMERQKSELLDVLNTPERTQRRTELTTGITMAEKELATLPKGKVVYAAATDFSAQGNFKPTGGTPRRIHRLHRGNETQPREAVSPGTLPLAPGDVCHFELTNSADEGQRRAALARWLVRVDHPLTWRSIVNRMWQYHFGRAIVDSPNDFGRMGQLPSHPELLDWLTLEFLRSGQSLKSLHRLIVTSAVYRQSSAGNSAAEQIDGENQFLWRMNRRRLEAEEVRDSILAVSGRLNPEMGGPGFYLFELEKPEHSPHYEYHKFDPEDVRSHRRSIYRFIVRSQPDPFMTTLDCADSSQSTPRRHETLTALQALSLLNNRFNLAMARHLATRLESASSDRGEQVNLAFELLTGRKPVEHELLSMRAYADRHGLPALGRLLFNLNEFMFVD